MGVNLLIRGRKWGQPVNKLPSSRVCGKKGLSASLSMPKLTVMCLGPYLIGIRLAKCRLANRASVLDRDIMRDIRELTRRERC